MLLKRRTGLFSYSVKTTPYEATKSYCGLSSTFVLSLRFVQYFARLPVLNLIFVCLTKPKHLNLSQATKFRHFQTERICRRELQI